MQLFLAALLAFAVTYFALPALIRIAVRKKLFDVPDQRKVHTEPKASLGGVGIFAGLSLSVLLFIPFSRTPQFQYLFGSLVIIFFVGLKDDLIPLSPLKKIGGQVLAALLLVTKGGLVLTSLHGFLGIGDLPLPVGSGLSFLAVLLLVNAFNLIDGVDGLASLLGLFAAALLGIYFALTGDAAHAVLAFALCGSLLAFLRFNFSPSRIFMGDTGSMLIGLVLSVLLCRFFATAPTSHFFDSSALPALGMSLVLFPLLDTFRVFGFRVWKGKSPFYPDRNHIHHILLEKGLSHRQISISLFFITAIVAALVLQFQELGSTGLIFLLFACYFAGIPLFWRLAGKGKRVKDFNSSVPTSPSKLKPSFRLWFSKKALAE